MKEEVPSMQSTTLDLEDNSYNQIHYKVSNSTDATAASSFDEITTMNISNEDDRVSKPTNAPCEVAKVSAGNETSFDDGDFHSIEGDTFTNFSDGKDQDIDSSRSEDSCAKDSESEDGNNSTSTHDDSVSNSSYLSINGLKWTEKKTSRVGIDYQVIDFPEAGSYLNLDGDDLDQLEQLLLTKKLWDPEKAIAKGLNDFVHLRCPSNKKEAALELLHQKDYYDPLSSDEIEALPVLDGSDWTMSEHENFRRLMQSTGHNVISVSKSMGKSVKNCLTVYYKIINVRETRSSKKHFTGRKPMDEMNQLKDIGRSLRIEKRNERKRIFKDDNDSVDATNPSIDSVKKRKKAAVTSNKPKIPTILAARRTTRSSTASSQSDQAKQLSESAPPTKEAVLTTPSTGRASRAAKERALCLIYSGGSQQELPSNTNVVLNLNHTVNDETKRITRIMKKSQNHNRKKSDKPEIVMNYSYLNLKPWSNSSDEEDDDDEDTKLQANRTTTLRSNVQNSIKSKEDNDDDNEGDETGDQDVWDLRFASLVAFKEKYGHCLVPKVFPADRKLSYWVFRQRGLYSKGNKKCSHGSLSKRRYKKLKDIGFVFRAKNSEEQIKVEAARRQPQLDAKWNRFYEEFCEYRKKTGSSLIPKVFEENQALSSW